MPVLRLLSPEGKEELGHIFKEGVPVQTYTPIWANLRGEPNLVFYVDWKSLSGDQQRLCLEYMSQKFEVPEEVIRPDIEAYGHFAIRHQWVIESYDMRMFV